MLFYNYNYVRIKFIKGECDNLVSPLSHEIMIILLLCFSMLAMIIIKNVRMMKKID